MLNSSNYEELMSSTPEATKSIFSSKWSNKAISFGDIGEFPISHGLYFVFLRNEVAYIGKADKQHMADRCKQYIGSSSGGTLRKKIELVRQCSPQDAIAFIKENMEARFIEIADVMSIPVLEEVAIWAFQSRLNAIKPEAFRFSRLALE